MASSNIPFLTIDPSAAQTHTVVFLHGRGDNARNFATSLHHSRDSQGRTLFDAFPSFRWVFPQAPTRQVASTGETWPQWFDVWNVRNFAEKEDLQGEGLKEVIPALRDILASEAASLSGKWDRVVLAGISMGAATSVHTLFNLDIPETGGGRLAAFLGFSCRCPFAGRSLPEMRDTLNLTDVPDHDRVVRNTPVMLQHCVDDPLVLLQYGKTLRDTLQGFGANVEWKEYSDGGHWFNSPRGMDDAVQFIQANVLQGTEMPETTSTRWQSASDAMDMS